jgi:uncharacterized protein (TIGR02452 family)
VNAQPKNNANFGGFQKFASGTVSTPFRPPAGSLIELSESGVANTRSLRPPPGSRGDRELWATSDPRWSVRRERGFTGSTVEQLRAMASETLAICDEGGYQSPSGRALELREQILRSVRGSMLFRPDHEFAIQPPAVPRPGIITVTPESVCEACKRLLAREEKIAILNFGSATRPGGAFATGRRGLEESLIRSTALYPTIARHEEPYRYALANPSPLGLDFLIYSPDVPFFREDNGDLMEEPFLVSVITAAPVQANQCRGKPALEAAIRDVTKRRLRKVVQLAIQFGYRVLLLGAFGCGICGNDPAVVAEIEKEILVDEGYAQFFDLIANPIQDGSRYQNYEVFAQVLAPYAGGGQ